MVLSVCITVPTQASSYEQSLHPFALSTAGHLQVAEIRLVMPRLTVWRRKPGTHEPPLSARWFSAPPSAYHGSNNLSHSIHAVDYAGTARDREEEVLSLWHTQQQLSAQPLSWTRRIGYLVSGQSTSDLSGSSIRDCHLAYGRLIYGSTTRFPQQCCAIYTLGCVYSTLSPLKWRTTR
jgi:hypothetical protein